MPVPGIQMQSVPRKTLIARFLDNKQGADLASRSPSKPHDHIQALYPPLPPPKQAPQPFQTQAGPLSPDPTQLIHHRRRDCAARRVQQLGNHRRRDTDVALAYARRVRLATLSTRTSECPNACRCGAVDVRGRPGLEPVAAEVEEAAVGPVARGQEEDQQQEAAVDAGAVEEVGADEEEEYEGRRGVGRDEEEGQPTVQRLACQRRWRSPACN
jgi:hypothetical protein